MINQEFKFPCGLQLKNRLVKPAMTEGLADEYQRATPRLCKLYSNWANEANVGMLISGNVQVDRRFLERPRNVVIDLDYADEREKLVESLKEYAKAGKQNDTKFVVQLGHAGRQATNLVAKKALAPSSITASRSGIPVAEAQAATAEEIERVVEKFVYAAKVCEDSGFDGIEIHSAHGYLLSSFLNPLANVREDKYGGSLENRSSLLLTIIQQIKEQRDEDFAVGVKLNSSDFQKGGFTVQDCIKVVQMLADEGIDFLELSGGNYESPVLQTAITENAGSKQKESTKKREAFFLVFAEEIVQALKEGNSELPIMVTGGFRSKKVMNDAIEQGSTNLIGIGRPLCMDPSCTSKLLNGDIDVLPQPEKTLHLPNILGWSVFQRFSYFQNFRFGGAQATYYMNFFDVADDKFKPDAKHNILSNYMKFQKIEKKNAESLAGYKDSEFIQDYLKPKN